MVSQRFRTLGCPPAVGPAKQSKILGPFRRGVSRFRRFAFQVHPPIPVVVITNPTVVGQSMRNRPKRVATKSPILFKIVPYIVLYFQFNTCKGFFFICNTTKVMKYLIFNVFIFPRFARFLFFSLFSSIINIYS